MSPEISTESHCAEAKSEESVKQMKVSFLIILVDFKYAFRFRHKFWFQEIDAFW